MAFKKVAEGLKSAISNQENQDVVSLSLLTQYLLLKFKQLALQGRKAYKQKNNDLLG